MTHIILLCTFVASWNHIYRDAPLFFDPLPEKEGYQLTRADVDPDEMEKMNTLVKQIKTLDTAMSSLTDGHKTLQEKTKSFCDAKENACTTAINTCEEKLGMVKAG